MVDYKKEKNNIWFYVTDRHEYYPHGLIFNAWTANFKHLVEEIISIYSKKRNKMLRGHHNLKMKPWYVYRLKLQSVALNVISPYFFTFSN